MKKSRDPLDAVLLLGCALGEEALKHIDICSEYFHDLRDTYGQDPLPRLRLISQDWFKS
jgi:hypothetical protein